MTKLKFVIRNGVLALRISESSNHYYNKEHLLNRDNLTEALLRAGTYLQYLTDILIILPITHTPTATLAADTIHTLRACPNFPQRKCSPAIFASSSVFFPVFTRQIVCYHPLKTRKTFLKNFQI